MVVGSVRILLSRVGHGLGVLWQDGEFVLRQGPYVEDVDQVLGLTLFVMNWVTLATVLAAMLLSVRVFSEYGSLSADAILARNGLHRHLWLVRGAALVLIASFLGVAIAFR